MRRRLSDRRLFRGMERSRLASMVLLLLMLVVLIPLVRQRTDWFGFFASPELPSSGGAGPPAEAATGGEDAKSGAKTGVPPGPVAKSAAAKSLAAQEDRLPVEAPETNSESLGPAESTTPTLSDEEERQRLKDLLSVVVDGTEKMAAREMPAYFHLLRKVQQELPEDLKTRARFNPKFNDFYQYASKYRGELVRVELNVRRIDRYEVNEENAAGLKEVYELWGWTEEAKAWLYYGIVPELPKGMKTGPVEERVTLVGYFFKLQGYRPGDAKPGDRSMVAPAIIGRIVWKPPAPPAKEPWWMWAAVSGVVVLIVGFLAVRILGMRRRRPGSKPRAETPGSAPDWLRSAPGDDQDKPS